MSRYTQRLSRVARVLGCPVHGEALVCPVCEPESPLPEALATGMETLTNAIVVRVGQDGLRAICRWVPMPPVYKRCGRCGSARTCLACREQHSQALLRAIELTTDEQAQLGALLAVCRGG
jgi:hypothetical protein